MRTITGAVCLMIMLHSISSLHAQEAPRHKLGLDEMFSLAERNSRSIRISDLALQEAEQSVRTARNAKLPSLDLSLSASYLGDGWMADRDFSNGTNAPMPHFGNNFAAEATQVIYAGGALSDNLEMARLSRQMSSLDARQSRQDIRFLLAGHYLELYKLRNQAEVYRKNIEQTRILLADIRERQAEGLALKNDITRYELQLQSLELALTQIENSRIIINDRLVTILGLPQQTLIEVDTTILSNLPPTGSEAYWQQAAADAPALQQAQLGVRRAERGIRLARAEKLPSVALFAGNRLDGPIIIEVPPINKNFNYWYAGIGLRFNIASTYKSGSKVAAAKIAARSAGENEMLVQENVRNEVTAAYIRFGEAFTTCITRKKNLELATENYEVIRYRYLNDLALITDMLDASNSKLDAELQVANARINILFCYYRLRKTAGIL